jgi:hypothetical protein
VFLIKPATRRVLWQSACRPKVPKNAGFWMPRHVIFSLSLNFFPRRLPTQRAALIEYQAKKTGTDPALYPSELEIEK